MTDAGFAPRPALEIGVLTKAGYGAAFDTDKLVRGLAVAARALNDGDLGRAMVAALHLRLPDLGPDGAASLRAVDTILAKYSADQPRDWHGRWTTEGAGSAGPGQAGVLHPTASRLIETGGADSDDGESPGIGDNSGLRPERTRTPDPDPDPALPQPKVPDGWDQPYRVVNGIEHPAERIPKLRNGQLWPTVDPDAVLTALKPVRGTNPTMKIYVSRDKVGPILVGSNEKGDFEQPPGYDVVYLRGAPQKTYSSGAETAHARESAVEALRLASTNEFSDIYFNRSFSTINDRMFESLRRPDVVGVARPTLDSTIEYQPYEILSPRQTHEEREDVMPRVSGVRRLQSRHYRMLLKLLHALLFKLQR